MRLTAMTAYILNLFDLGFTLYALSHGVKELNPFMQCVPFQIFYKVFVVGALLYGLSKVNSRLARFGLKIATAVYAVVNVWHIVNIAALVAV